MNQPITMPALSDTMNNGRLIKWVKKIGDPIKKGESVADVETDKAVMDVEAFHDGYLAGPLAAEGSELPVGATIGYIADRPDAAASALATAPAAATRTPSGAPAVTPAPTPAAASPPSAAPLSAATAIAPRVAAPPASASPVPSVPSASPQPERPQEPAAERVRASPYARRMARQLGVDVRQVISEHGEVHADAILEVANRSVSPDLAAGPPYRLQRTSSVREALARNMMRSLATPTFRMTARLPLAPLHAVSKNAQISLTLLLARACAFAIKAHPLLNAVYTPDGLALRDRVDISIAVDTPDGLIAPIIRDVATRPLKQLATDWQDVHEKALRRRLSLKEYQGATFYLSNLGMFPVVHSFDAVLPLGATAILCVAAEDAERASFTLSCDHRVLAGADAARFLSTLAEYLANPHRLAETPETGP